MKKTVIDHSGTQSIESTDTPPGCCHTCKKEFTESDDIKYFGNHHHHVSCIKAVRNRMAGRPNLCPKCNGTGSAQTTQVETDAKSILTGACDLCNGNGYTAKRFKPVTKVVGYEED